MEEIRSRYLRAFHNGLEDLKREGRDCHSEIRLELHTQHAHELYRLFVCDVIEKKPDGSTGVIEFNIDPVQAAFPGLAGLHPLVWNSITFACSQTHFVEADVVSWGERWSHDEAPPLGAQDELTGIIHSVTEPEVKDGLVRFSVDFGSAPLQALNELLGILAPGLRSADSVFESSDA